MGPPDAGERVLRLREMFVQSPSFSALLEGSEHRFVLTNPAYQRLIGDRDVIGLPLREALPEVERQGFVALLDKVFATGEAAVGRDVKVDLEQPPDGAKTTCYVDFVYQPIRDEKGRVGAIFVEGADVTLRHRADEALRASADRLKRLNADLERQVIERAQARGRTWKLSPDLLGALDAKGYFVTANPAWESVLGWTEEEVTSMSIFDLLHPEDREHTRAGFELCQADQPALRFANRYRCKDGSYRWISWIGIPEDGYVYCTGRDITAERAAADELAAAQEALRQSQKIETIGQLSAGIAHDFNNLLAAIMGALDLSRRRVAAGRLDEVPKFLDAAFASARQAGALTHRLLAFGRRQSLKVAPNDINRVVATAEAMLRRTLGDNITLACELVDGLWSALCDANQIESAILNLAINARDAMADGGRITIGTRNVHLDETGAAAEDHVSPGDYVAISVSDTGSGMPADVLARAIDPFFTTKGPGRGTGLGLSMVYGLAKQLGGGFRIESAPGRGTTAMLTLPRARHEAVDLERPMGAVPRGRGETILVVEDDATLRLILGEALKELGYEVALAADARPAIAVLESPQRIDLMMTDFMLPHVNGRKLAEVARTERPGLKVLFVTGYADDATFRSNPLGGGMDLLRKPFAIDTLGAKVRAMIERAPPAST